MKRRTQPVEDVQAPAAAAGAGDDIDFAALIEDGDAKPKGGDDEDLNAFLTGLGG